MGFYIKNHWGIPDKKTEEKLTLDIEKRSSGRQKPPKKQTNKDLANNKIKLKNSRKVFRLKLSQFLQDAN